MLLANFLTNLISISQAQNDIINNNYHSARIVSLETDSRLIKKGSIFFALKGRNFDGIKFIEDALNNGAIAVICRKIPKNHISQEELNNRLILEVEDPDKILIKSLQKFYPNLPRNILAVTGTNGKTSVTHFIWQLQEILGKKAAVIGTNGIKTFDSKINSKLNHFGLTTPDIVSLYKNLAILKENGVDDVAIEASSIGLEQNRLAGLKIGLGAFTNFTQDHLDYHQTMDEYFNCKMLLFTEILQPNDIAILNADISQFKKVKDIALKRGLKIFSYSKEMKDKNIKIPSQFAAEFHESNIICALTCIFSYYQLDQEKQKFLINNLEKIKVPEGRMQLIATLSNRAKIFIDYAHTPDALENILQAARKLPHKRLIILFGCGGNRDKSKRPKMGKIASTLADLVIIADDNPRFEDAKTIRKEILSGCDLTKTLEFEYREKAINQAISMLERNDILIIAGKGHEKYQIIGDKTLDFDEEAIVNKFIKNEI